VAPGNRPYADATRGFLSRWPDPQAWAAEPLPVRLSASKALRPFLMFLMLAGYLRPGYDYLLARKLASVLREAPASPLGDQLARFLAAAAELGYSKQVRLGMASLVTMRLLIQAGSVLTGLTDADIATFGEAITVRERACGRSLKHYRTALYATRAVIYHLGGALTPAAAKDTAHLRWEWARYFEGVHGGVGVCLPGMRLRHPDPVDRLAQLPERADAVAAQLHKIGNLELTSTGCATLR
jgi:hypothetical protein